MMETHQPVNYRGWRGYVISECADLPTLDRLITIHDAIQRGEATVFQNSEGRAVAMIKLTVRGELVPLLVKEDNVTQSGIRTLIKNQVRPSRARMTWRRTMQLRAAGVVVPAPVALLEWRRWGVLQKTVYVGGYAPDAAPIAHVLRGSGGARIDRDGLLETFARELRTMHDRGFYHGDLKAGNVLAERQAIGWLITFIDLENVAVTQHVTEEERAIDLGRLWLALLPMTSLAERERFFEAYAVIPPAIDQVLLRRFTIQRVNYLKVRRFDRLPEIGATLRGKTGQPQRWLIIALGSADEAWQMAPLLALLQRGFPGIQVDLLVDGGAASVLAHDPNVHVIMAISGKLVGRSSTRGESMSVTQAIRSLRSRDYQVAIDLTDSVFSAFLTRVTSSSVRIGYRRASVISKWLRRASCYTHMILARPEQREPVDHYLLVAKALDADATGREVEPTVTVPRRCSDPVVRGGI